MFGYVEHRPKCHAGKDLLLIRPDGNIHCCAGWKECKDMIVGSVGDSLEDIWLNSPVLQLIRAYNHYNLARGICTGCPWLVYCGGGCPAQRIIHNRSRVIPSDVFGNLVIGTDPMCPRYNGFLSDKEISRNRKGAILFSSVEQDEYGNVVQGVMNK